MAKEETSFERARRLTQSCLLCGLAWLVPLMFASCGPPQAVEESAATGDGIAPGLGSTGELDRFGGWKGKRFEATGFFRTQHDGRRWWLGTPEGHAFLSLGLNHYHAAYWSQEYNKDHWVEEWGATAPYDAAWNEGFRDRVLFDREYLGTNSLGYHSETPQIINRPLGPVMPYVRQFQPVRFSFWMRVGAEAYLDIFAPEFVSHCEEEAGRLVAPHADDELILGWAMADIPILTDEEVLTLGPSHPGATTWPRVLRNLGAHAPGKQEYVATMRGRHADVAAFNSAYGTSFAGWDDLAAATSWRPNTDMGNQTEKDDNRAFLRRCVDRYYSVAREAVLEYDRNHMFLGDKLHGNTDQVDSLVDITSRHTDVVLVQVFGRWDFQRNLYDRWSASFDKPLLNGDHAYALPPTEMMPKTMAPPAAGSEAEAAAWTVEFGEGAFARPDFVGWHICGVTETWRTMPGFEGSQKPGLMTPLGAWHRKLVRAVQDLSRRMYQIHLGDTH